MKSVSGWSVSALLAVSFAAALVAQAPALDVKMGLWEMSSTTQMGGQMPAMDTSTMTPEQKKKLDDAMKQMMGEAHTNVSKSCVTRDKLEKSVFMMENQPGQTCKQTLTNNTRSMLDATITCTGQHPMTGQMHIDALSPTSIKGTVKAATTEQGRTMTMNMAMTGKWLGADCGSEK